MCSVKLAPRVSPHPYTFPTLVGKYWRKSISCVCVRSAHTHAILLLLFVRLSYGIEYWSSKARHGTSMRLQYCCAGELYMWALGPGAGTDTAFVQIIFYNLDVFRFVVAKRGDWHAHTARFSAHVGAWRDFTPPWQCAVSAISICCGIVSFSECSKSDNHCASSVTRTICFVVTMWRESGSRLVSSRLLVRTIFSFPFLAFVFIFFRRYSSLSFFFSFVLVVMCLPMTWSRLAFIALANYYVASENWFRFVKPNGHRQISIVVAVT